MQMNQNLYKVLLALKSTMDLRITGEGDGLFDLVHQRDRARSVNNAARQLVHSLDAVVKIPADFETIGEGETSARVYHTETGKPLYDVESFQDSDAGYFIIKIHPLKGKETKDYLKKIKH